jgi:anti-sigma factor RsiW
MHDNLLNILSDSNKDIDNQKLMDYISGKLSGEQKHEVEKWMADNPLVSEAIEGLQQTSSENSAKAVEQINKQLRIHLQQRKRKKESRFIPVNMWTYVAIVLILLIIVVAVFVLTLKD